MSSWIERLRMLERLDALIRRKATGNRKILAKKLEVSVRTVSNLKTELEDLGAEVSFDKHSNSYVYDKPIKFNWVIVGQTDEWDHLNGGRSNILRDNWITNNWNNCFI